MSKVLSQQVSDTTEMSNLQSTSTNTCMHKFSPITLRNTVDEFSEMKYSPHLVSFMYFQDTECMLNKYNKFCMLPLEKTTHACIHKISTLSKQETSKRKRKEPDYSKEEEALVDKEDDSELKIIDACVVYPNKLVKKNKK